MAQKSIYQIMQDRLLPTTDNKAMEADEGPRDTAFTVEVPEWFPTAATEEECQKVIDHFGVEAVVLTALAQVVIDCRETARRTNKVKDGDRQAAVDAVKIEAPRVAGDPAEKLAKSMAKATPEQIRAALLKQGIDVKDLM
jgi:hypothetical protein